MAYLDDLGELSLMAEVGNSYLKLKARKRILFVHVHMRLGSETGCKIAEDPPRYYWTVCQKYRIRKQIKCNAGQPRT